MGYIEQNLVAGETVAYRTRLHWIMFLWPAVFLILAIIGFVGRQNYSALALFIGLIWGLNSYINFTSSEFGVTNRRVLIKVGFIRRHSLELLLPKVEGIAVDQGILGRILGYGTIIVTGTGGTKEPFRNIAAPMEFRKMVQQQTSSS
jgi:uncharacterized membrane protein YdbT with pleckstrin-like domain